MTEYWKSQPKKFCGLCKCWFADNPTSISIHDKGVSHQDNLKRKILQINEESKKKEKEQTKHDKIMRDIEKAANASIKEDLLQYGLIDDEEIPSLYIALNKGQKEVLLPAPNLKDEEKKPKKAKKANKDKKGDKQDKTKIGDKIPQTHNYSFIGKWKTVSKEESMQLKINDNLEVQPPPLNEIDLQLPKVTVRPKKIFYQVVEQNIKNPELNNQQDITGNMFFERSNPSTTVFTDRPIDKKHQLDDSTSKFGEMPQSTLFMAKKKKNFNVRSKIIEQD